jgi:hypothetical protein
MTSYPSNHFRKGSPTTRLCLFLIFPMSTTCPNTLFFLQHPVGLPAIFSRERMRICSGAGRNFQVPQVCVQQLWVVFCLMRRNFMRNFLQQTLVTMVVVTCDVDSNHTILIRLPLAGWAVACAISDARAVNSSLVQAGYRALQHKIINRAFLRHGPRMQLCCSGNTASFFIHEVPVRLRPVDVLLLVSPPALQAKVEILSQIGGGGEERGKNTFSTIFQGHNTLYLGHSTQFVLKSWQRICRLYLYVTVKFSRDRPITF